MGFSYQDQARVATTSMIKTGDLGYDITAFDMAAGIDERLFCNFKKINLSG